MAIEYIVDHARWNRLGTFVRWSGSDASLPATCPFNVQLTERCNMRAAGGWSLVGTIGDHYLDEVCGAWLFFERDDSK